MATKKITELNQLAGADIDQNSDVLAIVDLNNNETKKVTVSALHSGSFSGSFTGDGSGLTGVISASYAVSASVEIVKEISSSHANVADFASSGNGIFSGSFSGSYEGDGTNLNLASNTTIPSAGAFPFNGDAVISGSLLISASEQTASLILKSSGSTILDVRGSLGSMFSVTDSFDGNLFEVNNISGISLLSVSSSGDVDIPKGSLTVSGGLAIEGITDVSASIAAAGGGGGSAFPFVGDAQITGSLLITGSVELDYNGGGNMIIGSGSGEVLQSGGINNLIFGNNAATSLTTGDQNVIIGNRAGDSSDLNVESNNVYIGYEAGKDATHNASYGDNVFVGTAAGKGSKAQFSSFIGSGAGNGVSAFSVGIGANALSSTAEHSVAIGYSSQNNGTNHYNVSVGSKALNANNTMANNEKTVAIGYYAAQDSYNVDDGIYIGYYAGQNTNTSRGNIIIGSGSLCGPVNYQLRIGHADIHPISASLETGDVIFYNTASAPNFSGSFQGDGSGLTGVGGGDAFPFTGTARITGSTIISASGAQALEVIGSGSTVFSVVGSTGTLFEVDDSLEGIIFTANDSTGAPSFQVSSSGELFLGKSPQSLYTTKQITSTISTATESIFSMTTSSLLTTLAFDYSCVSESNARAGTINSVFIPGTDLITFSETATSDIGDTSGVHLSVEITQSQAQFLSKTDSAGWRIKSIIRSI